MSTHENCPDAGALVSYLYDEFEPGVGPIRQDVARHLKSCARCASEVAALGGVREQLTAWTTPEMDLGFRVVQDTPPVTGWRAWTSWAMPVPARQALPMAAAAILVLGGALGLARLDIQYDANGLKVRTGWGHDASRAASGAPAQPVSATSPVPLTAADLKAFETRLRRELTSSVAATNVVSDPAPATRFSDAALLRQVRQIVDESEVRQQQNLQLRVSELARDFQIRRQADLVQIEQGFGRLAGDTAQQRQMLNQYLRNVSTTTTGVRPQ